MKRRNFCMTLWLHVTERCWEEILHEMIDTGVLAFCAYGEETCPSTGALHYQAYCSFPNARSPKAVLKLFPQCHVEVMQGSLQQNETYCSKEGTFTKLGVEPAQGTRTDLTDIKRRLDDGEHHMDVSQEDDSFAVVARHHRFFEKYENHVVKKQCVGDYTKPNVYIRYGDAGTGKTRHVHEFDPNVYVCPDNTGKWFDGYRGQPTVLFDDVEIGQIPPLALFKRLTDRYRIDVAVKGGFVNWKPKNIYITSNSSPYTWWKDLSAIDYAALQRRFFRIERVYKDTTEVEYQAPDNGVEEEG